MAKSLTGITWCYNAICQDYCLEEAVKCLREFCAEVIVLDAGSIDGSDELVKSLQDKKTKAILCSQEEWLEQQGKEKLSYFTNKAIEAATSEFIFSLQADEILHEKCYDSIHRAIFNNYDGCLVKRLNLWGTCNTMLNVEHSRKPCSDIILRLGKKDCRAYSDAESLACNGDVTDLFVDDIVIWHYGFVRSAKVHADKIRHMQKEIFLTTPDAKLQGMSGFEWERWFSKEDLIPIPGEHPKIMQEWVKTRP